ncbi:hypothetical protein J6590_097146, partial [Homalodisca vitripennis]
DGVTVTYQSLVVYLTMLRHFGAVTVLMAAVYSSDGVTVTYHSMVVYLISLRQFSAVTLLMAAVSSSDNTTSSITFNQTVIEKDIHYNVRGGGVSAK